jgi:ABC-2 type transport system ATP-binding protein
MSGPAISIKNVTKLYGGTSKGITNVSLEVASGEIYGFLGPNGAGKTTAIRCIMDFIKPQSGTIKVFGKDANTQAVEARAQIGFLASDPQLYPRWTGVDFLNYLGTMRGPADMSSIVKRLGLDTSIQYRHLSSGNKQKLSLLVALYGSPKLIIMDEPTKGLDPLLQQEIYAILNEYKNAGGTVFLSSHNLPEVEKICDRVGVIKNGRIVASESMQSIRELAIHIVSLATTKEINKADFSLPHVEITHYTPKHMLLRVRGDLNPLLKAVHKYTVTDLEINHANLEDIFLEYYK